MRRRIDDVLGLRCASALCSCMRNQTCRVLLAALHARVLGQSAAMPCPIALLPRRRPQAGPLCLLSRNAEDILHMPWGELRKRTNELLGELGVPVSAAAVAKPGLQLSGRNLGRWHLAVGTCVTASLCRTELHRLLWC